MTIPKKYANTYLPVKYFLSSYRAYSDGCQAVKLLEKDLEGSSLMLSDWKIHWIAACALLRGAIDLFKLYGSICVNRNLAQAFKDEWAAVGATKEDHPVFWNFLRDERNSILHEYRWSAYEEYLHLDGTIAAPRPSILLLSSENYESSLRLRSGAYSGRQALDVIQESRDWVRDRINSAICRAGLKPDEERNIVDFSLRPKVVSSLIGGSTILRSSNDEQK